MSKNRIAIFVAALAIGVSGVWAQSKPVVAVLSVDSPLYTAAAVSETRIGARLTAGEPLLIVGSQDKRLVIDGVPAIWYQVKTSEEATGWIPGSRMSFSGTAFKRSAFQTQDQYAA